MSFFKSFFGNEWEIKRKLNWQRKFYEAIKKGERDVVNNFLKKGTGNVNLRDNDLCTPLHIASWHKQADLVKLFLKLGAEVNAKSAGNGTALHLAGSFEVAKLLINNGAEIHAKRKGGDTPLHRACTGDIVKLLIEFGANVNERNNNGLTPVHRAFRIDVLNALIEHGADVNAKDTFGRTPLFKACQCGSTEVVTVLLSNGADPNVEDKSGSTSLMLACMNHLLPQNYNAEIVNQLMLHGVKMDLNNESFKKALKYAMGGEQFKIIKIITNA